MNCPTFVYTLYEENILIAFIILGLILTKFSGFITLGLIQLLYYSKLRWAKWVHVDLLDPPT